MNSKIARVALVLAPVAAGGAATAVGVKIYRYHFEGRGTDGNYHFRKEPDILYTSSESGVTVSRGGSVTIDSNDPNFDVEQMQKDLEEVAILRQADERELLGVVDTEVNGHFHRAFQYKYTLSDGRTLRVGENDPELPPVNSLGGEKTHEVWKLRGLKQGDFLGYSDRDVHGRAFTFETYLFTLSDGTVVTHAVGEAKDLKTRLTATDWEEFRSLREAEAGADLGTYEEEIRGTLFVFERKLYVLSDGTEVVWSIGKPKND